MRYFLFVPTISYWQYLVMSAAIGAAALLHFEPLSLFVWLGIVVVGGAIQGFVEFIDDTMK